MIKVVCGIIYNGGEIFIARRKPEKSMGGLWEFPGGKLEPNENEITCLKRELQEELEMEIENIDYYKESAFKNSQVEISLVSYKAQLTSWNGTLIDHDKYNWVNPSQLHQYEFSPPDILLVNSIIKEI